MTSVILDYKAREAVRSQYIRSHGQPHCPDFTRYLKRVAEIP
jgi:hypothetical protein